MELDFEKTPFLFSVGTWCSYFINRRYYNGVHYVWCTTTFDRKKQPITSNPYHICKRFIEQMFTGDNHTQEIANNISGLLKGMVKKREQGVIDDSTCKEIQEFVNLLRFEHFFPVLYVIDGRKVGNERCIEVPKEERAGTNSIEYRIFDLKDGEFEIIDLRRLFSEFIDLVDEKPERRINK